MPLLAQDLNILSHIMQDMAAEWIKFGHLKCRSCGAEARVEGEKKEISYEDFVATHASCASQHGLRKRSDLTYRDLVLLETYKTFLAGGLGYERAVRNARAATNVFFQELQSEGLPDKAGTWVDDVLLSLESADESLQNLLEREDDDPPDDATMWR